MERAIAFILCIGLLVPMIYIEHGYDAFTSNMVAREGAGAGLALAVVFRTVSRTVLRTIVRTSARVVFEPIVQG